MLAIIIHIAIFVAGIFTGIMLAAVAVVVGKQCAVDIHTPSNKKAEIIKTKSPLDEII